jgi:glycosyltransferase involved in cell wall biosynthesis
MRWLWQLQLSNQFDGKFSLTGDSNWTMFIAKARELKKHDPDIQIYLVVPFLTHIHEDIHHELVRNGILGYVYVFQMWVPRNAILSRYHFDIGSWESLLTDVKPDIVYMNDPCLVGNIRAVMTHLKSKALLISQCHFLDSPETPLVPVDCTYWNRTVEATEKADLNVWHCTTQMMEWADLHPFNHHKSVVWKSGHSTEMLDEPINMNNLRFDYNSIPHGAKVVWVPNRIGGLGKSFDYTNNGRFLFEELPKVINRNFIVLCGNPSQKITNQELTALVPEYMELVPGAMNYDEYKWCTQRADIVVSLYDKDSNGGIAVLEAIYHGAIPLMPDINEYSRYFEDASFPYAPRVMGDLLDIANTLDVLQMWMNEPAMPEIRRRLQKAIEQHSIENATKQFYEALSAKLSAI